MSELKVLVVDDEPGIRSGISRILRGFKVGYPFMDEDISFQVLEAATGEEGIEIIESTHPDIILLDNKLPGIQGTELLSYVKKKALNIVVVMITSYASLEIAVQATRDGAYDFIPKPFTPQELRSSMETITKHVFLKKMTEKLQSAGKEVRFQFLSILSHELKAPLNALEGYVDLIRNKEMGDKIDDYQDVLDRIMKRIGSMRSLIMDLLDLTRIESGKSVKKLSMFNLANTIQNAIDTMKPYAIQKDVEVVKELHIKPEIFADEEEIEIVLNNLISNAIKYNKQNGSVLITLDEDDQNIIISIKDTGIGIERDHAENLFKEFYRIRNENTKKIAGSGLGLSIVKKIIDSYHGSISVESTPDQGSEFTVKLEKNNISQK